MELQLRSPIWKYLLGSWKRNGDCYVQLHVQFLKLEVFPRAVRLRSQDSWYLQVAIRVCFNNQKSISWLNASSVRLKRGQALDSETEELPLYQIFRGMWLGLRGSTSAEVTKTKPAEEMSTP